MATISVSYATGSSPNFLASALLSDTNLATGRAGNPYSNATTLYVDILFGGEIPLATSVTLNSQVEVWMAANHAGFSSDLTANCPTVEGAFTPGVEKQLLQLVTIIAVTSTATTAERGYSFGPYSIASLFGGVVPSTIVPVVFQNTGVALGTGTATNAFFQYLGINYTSA